ncbi:hypothetical protein Tel_01460 [Candidatus Tenderia electrophaga]|uniref:Methyl-accepting transducer domain-containing protein n=1 Tax=Candidatus Tenderia electrophaga TaxID=1748243 RepID=A0A0S2T9T5_9GAMM|nr:hypothetical protein Tel_01460 [Candidatus Tenderia electrophaga]
MTGTTHIGGHFTLQGLYRDGDRIMVSVIWLCMLLSLALAGWYGTWQEALIIGLPAAIVPSVLVYSMPGTRLTRIVNGCAFMIFSALFIHQGHGMIELHFGIFALLAFLLYYRDWLPIVAAAGVIAVHHLSFNFFQAWGYGVYVFENRTGVDLVLIHAAYVVFEVAVLVYMALKLHKEGLQSQEVGKIAAQLAVRDGDIDLRVRSEVQTGVAAGINAFMQNVHDAIAKTRTVSEKLAEVAGSVNQVIHDSNQGAQRQRAETDQVATAMNQMTSTVQEVTRNAEEAANYAVDADDVAAEGSAVVDKTVAAINAMAERVERVSGVISRVEEDSNNIGSVLDVIKEIAEQTNLLALNAAIEAARAGEQGRGFAVVADEVRTLAGRTQQSTEEIQRMIEALQSGSKEAVTAMEEGRNQAQDGVTQASQAGEALANIVQSVSRIREMNTQIATAAEQQSSVAEEINRNIVNIHEISGATAGSMSTASSSSDELARLSRELEQLVKHFRV